jgi:hypothetical protein
MLTRNWQIGNYRNINIPILLSEYGNNTQSPRTFSETTALYSPKMTAIFSGGCVYELWQGSNVYGLAQMERKEADLRIPRPPGKVAETRHSVLGTLHLFEDFMNYKARLASSSDLPACTDDVLAKAERKAEGGPDSLSGERTIEGTVPETCLNWARIVADVNAASSFGAATGQGLVIDPVFVVAETNGSVELAAFRG